MPTLGTIADPSQEQIHQRRRQTVQDLMESAVNHISAVNGRQDVHVRDLMPELDLHQGADNNWTDTNREWLQSGLTADSLNEVYTIDSDNRAQNEIIQVYGVANVAPDVLTTEIEFQNNTGSPVERAQVQSLEITELSDIVLFEQDIQFGVDQNASIHQWSNAAGDDRVVYLGKTAQQADTDIAKRQTGR